MDLVGIYKKEKYFDLRSTLELSMVLGKIFNPQKLLVSLVLVTYFIGLSSVILPLIEYAADYQRIIQEECENIAKPELQCNGKCYLTEQITKQAVPEAQSSGTKVITQKSGVDPHYSQLAAFKVDVSLNTMVSVFAVPFDDIILSRIDHPPQS
ncbi:MAG: hypothetical protein L3J79_00525 [Candidatus Marinimicrobia bacterium]|nr:hypothetical protein [Candidatus Neomarinimicrobiota bacterium]